MEKVPKMLLIICLAVILIVSIALLVLSVNIEATDMTNQASTNINKGSDELSVYIYSVEIFPPLVGENDTIDVNITIRTRVLPVRVLVTINAPDFAILIGNQSEIISAGYLPYLTNLSLKLKAIKRGEYTCTIKLYLLNVTPIEIDSRNIMIRVVSKVMLEVEVYDIIFNLPLDNADILAVSKEYRVHYILSRGAKGNVYMTNLPKSTYNIVANGQIVAKTLLLDKDTRLVVKAFGPISFTVFMLSAIASAILPPLIIPRYRYVEYLFWVFVSLQFIICLIATILPISSIMRPYEISYEALPLLLVFIETIAVNIFSLYIFLHHLYIYRRGKKKIPRRRLKRREEEARTENGRTEPY